MKTIRTEQRQRSGRWLVAVCGLLAGLGLTAAAQTPVAPRPAEELEALLAPVALYPDALLAVMLPAATAPSDVVLAAHYLAAGGAVEQLDAQPWDDSVRTLARYPEVLQWMAANLVWTEAVGQAFRLQPADVLAAIQRLRVRAQALGNLPDTPQQRVVYDQNLVTIIPADPEVVYVPQYDPQVIFLQPAPFGGCWLNFGFCWRIGAWHRYDFDWRRCAVRIRERHPQFRQPVEVIRAWHPAPVAQHPSVLSNRSAVAAPQAHPVASRAAPHLQANQVAVPQSPATTWTTQREAPQHNTGFTHADSHSVPQPVFTTAAQVKQSVPHYEAAARPEFRVPQASPALARLNAANAPQQEPRVQRSAPAALPAAQPAVLHAVHAAPPAAPVQRQVPASGNNQSDRMSGSGDRSANGHWGNMARGN